MARFSALLDACVLVPYALTDTLLRLADAGLYRPLWSDRIIEEMVVAVERVHPELADGRARRRAAGMNSAFEDAAVQDWEALEGSIDLPDRHDRHVAAAAIRGQAELLVTHNVRDFPPDALAPSDIEVQTPDQFLLNQLDLDPDVVIRALHEQPAAQQQPAISFDEVLAALERCHVPGFAEAAARQRWRWVPSP